MKNSSGFIFDMDGTLVDSMPYHTLSWQQLLGELGVKMTGEEIERRNHGILPEVIRNLLGDQLTQSEVVAIGERKEELYRAIYNPHLQLLTGCQEFLEQAYQLDVAMAVATMANNVNVAFVLDGLEIRDYFKVVIGEEDVQRGKPSPESFLFAAQGLQLPPENCIVFEDSLAGVEAAQRAGMKVVFLSTTLNGSNLPANPSILQVAGDYENLDPEILLSMSRVG
jgi:beta-phosphoglucomutase family hydrolase